MNVRRLLFVHHPAERMYDLIEGAEYYPDFLPWCSKATDTTFARLQMVAKPSLSYMTNPRTL